MTYFNLCMPLCYVCLELLLALLGFSSVLEYVLQGFNETCKVLFELKHKLMNILTLNVTIRACAVLGSAAWTRQNGQWGGQ